MSQNILDFIRPQMIQTIYGQKVLLALDTALTHDWLMLIMNHSWNVIPHIKAIARVLLTLEET